MNRLSLALLLVFFFLVSGLAVELVYVLWYRRRFRLESTASNDVERSVVSSALSNEPNCYGTPPPSKELVLYYLCWKNQSRAENSSPNIITPVFPVNVPPVFLKPPPRLPPPPPPPPAPAVAEEEEDDDEELEKFRQLHGARLLYTIKEEDNPAPETHVVAAGQEEQGEMESAPVGETEVVGVEDEEEENASLFSSACSSPFYTTPTSSPSHPATMNNDVYAMVD